MCAGEETPGDGTFLQRVLLLAASILRLRCNSGGLVGGGEDDGALAVLKGHLAIVRVVLSTLKAVGTNHAVEGFLPGGGGGILAVLEDDLGDISTAHLNSWKYEGLILTMPLNGSLLFGSDILQERDACAFLWFGMRLGGIAVSVKVRA